ncbi:MAG: hypothetical protein WB643_03025, partial [Candidatus Bathyarchaeia archaeon]
MSGWREGLVAGLRENQTTLNLKANHLSGSQRRPSRVEGRSGFRCPSLRALLLIALTVLSVCTASFQFLPNVKAAFSPVASLALNPSQDYAGAVVIDRINGYAFFGTTTIPGMIIKVRLSDFEVIASLTLPQNESNLQTAVIDPMAHYAYFGLLKAPAAIIKIDLSTFTRVAAISLNPGENNLMSSVMGFGSTFAYFGTGTSPGIVVRIRLSDFTRVDSLTLNPGENSLVSAVTDGFDAYFGTDTSPGMIVKVHLADFTRVGSLTLNPGENQIRAAVLKSIEIDGQIGNIYAGTYTSPGYVVKIFLNDFTRAGVLTLDDDERYLATAVTDGSYVYFGSNTLPGVISKVQISDFTHAGKLTLNSDEGALISSVMDGTYAYFGTGTTPGKIVKVRLSDFTRVDALTLNTVERQLTAAVIDNANGFAYFGTETSPAKVVKLRLSDFTRVDVLTLNAGENEIESAVIDSINGFAYFGTSDGLIVKVRLSDFSRVSSVDSGAYYLRSAVIDAANGYAYFAAGVAPSVIVKVRLSDFTIGGSLTLDSDEDYVRSAVIDGANGFAYFGTGTAPGKVIKIRLSNFTRADAMVMDSGEDYLSPAVLDLVYGFAYFATQTSPSIIVKIRLSNFTKVNQLSLNPPEADVHSAVLDSVRGYAYFSTFQSPSTIVKVSLTDFTRVGSVVLQSIGTPEWAKSAVIDAMNGFAYFGTAGSDIGTDPTHIVKVDVSGVPAAFMMTVSYDAPQGITPSTPPELHYVSGGSAAEGPLHTYLDGYYLDYGSTWTIDPPPTMYGMSWERWTTLAPSSGLADGIIYHASFFYQYQKSLSYSAVNPQPPWPPTFSSYQYGSMVNISLPTAPTNYWWDVNSHWSVSKPLCGLSCAEVWLNDPYQSTSGTIVNDEPLSFAYTSHWYMMTLTAGWNLVSLPVIPVSTAIKDVLSSQISSKKLGLVWSYTGTPRAWKFYQPGKTSTLANMVDGDAYWVYMKSGDTLYMTGTVFLPTSTPPIYKLTVGWNLVGFKPQPVVQNLTVGQYLSSIAGQYDAHNVWIYDSMNGSWTRATSSTWLEPCDAM